MEISPFDQLKFALDAYNDANRQSNQMWSVTALVALFVLSFTLGSNVNTVFGIEIGGIHTLAFLIILLSATNIAYSVCHVSAYRIAAVYQSLVRTHFGKNKVLTDEFTWFDLAQRAPISNFNRIYPLFLPIERWFGNGFYRAIKITYDSIFCGFPSFAIVVGVVSIEHTSTFRYLAISMGVFSVFSTLLLFRWIVKWPGIAADPKP